MGRVRYYFYISIQVLKSRGFLSFLVEIFRFLISRRLGLSFIWEALDYQFFSRLRSPLNSVIFEIGNLPPSTEKFCLYSTFDSGSVLLPYVLVQLAMLRKAGFSVLVISTSPQLTSDQAQKLLAFANAVIHRSNVGWDFGSWRTGWEWSKTRLSHTPKAVLLMNDSCWGPYFSTESLFSALELEVDQVIGLTQSQQIVPHLQSYFLHFGRKLWERGVTQAYMERIHILATKRAVVRYFEIGGTVWLNKVGVIWKSWVNTADAKSADILGKAVNGNPTEGRCAADLVDCGYLPFFKKSNLKGAHFPKKHGRLAKDWGIL